MGGGAMRTTAKVVCRSIGASSSSHAAAGISLRASSAPAETVRSISIASTDLQEVEPLSGGAQKPSWQELDDWEWAESAAETGARAGAEAEEGASVALDSNREFPRIIFGHFPTLSEATQAAAELKDAIEIVLPSRVGSAEEAGCEAAQPIPSSIVPSIPESVRETFQLMQRNPVVQDVVASLAADKNVWLAIEQNEKVMKLCKTHTSLLPHKLDATSKPVHAAEVDGDAAEVDGHVPEMDGLSAVALDGHVAIAEAIEALPLEELVNTVKEKVMEVVSGLSNFIQEFFKMQETNERDSDEAGTPLRLPRPLGEALMALTLATILVIMVKRGL